MSTIKKNSRNWKEVFIIGSIFLLQFVLVGCAANQTKFNRSSELTEVFENYQVLPDYQYYATGPYDDPYAILGVHRDYSFDTMFWRKYDMTPELLYRWLRQFESRNDVSFLGNYFGSNIVSTAGEKIGIWYSMHDWTTVKILANNKVEIFPPNTLFMGDTSERGIGGRD